MTWKHIEASREVRLWLTQVIMPVAGIFTTAMVMVPEFREAVTTGAKNVKNKIESVLHK